jgi:hypothetical protein
MFIFIKNSQVLQHEERISKVKLRKVLFKINMLQKTKIIPFIIKDLLLTSYSLKVLFNTDDVFGEKNWFKSGTKSIIISSVFYQTGPLAQNFYLGLFERSKKSMTYTNIWLKTFSKNTAVTHNARGYINSFYSPHLSSLDSKSWNCMSGLNRKL